jgi:catechol 2,3-dioxygenase-like lactoylglutathione lyase family enzyme
MKIYITSVFVDDQDKALDFYTRKLGFEKKTDIPLGQYRWLTVIPAGEQDGVELLLEPAAHPAVKPYRKALVDDGIPCTSFEVTDLEAEVARLKSLNVSFTLEPVAAGDVKMAVFDDSCGNLIQIIQRIITE